MRKFFVNGGARGAGVIAGTSFREPTIVVTNRAYMIAALENAGSVATEDPDIIKAKEERHLPVLRMVDEVEDEVEEEEDVTEDTSASALTRDQLRERCKKVGLPINGSKPDLIARLEEAGAI